AADVSPLKLSERTSPTLRTIQLRPTADALI
ncbi:MAG: hypothetical protein ACI9OD_002679, partial [Limisphaerales bacterium]